MRLQVLSDLHLESGRFEPVPKKADVVVLAGNIHQGTAGVKWAKQYFRDCPVIYVPGNHEFYNHSIPDLIRALEREAKGSNVLVLENNTFKLAILFSGMFALDGFSALPECPRGHVVCQSGNVRFLADQKARRQQVVFRRRLGKTTRRVRPVADTAVVPP